MAKQLTLRPVDVPVALRLAVQPESTFEALRDDLGISTSTAHEAVMRLIAAGIVYPHARRVNRHNLVEFLEHGVKYAFPALPRGKAKGVPTAHAAPPLSGEIVQGEPLVWPDPRGSVYGDAVDPLYERAVELPSRCPSVYELLTLVDALRIGRARERALATEALRSRLKSPTSNATADA